MHYGHVDPDQGGMVDGAMEKNEKPSSIPAPVNQFKGDPAQAFWFLIVR